MKSYLCYRYSSLPNSLPPKYRYFKTSNHTFERRTEYSVVSLVVPFQSNKRDGIWTRFRASVHNKLFKFVSIFCPRAWFEYKDPLFALVTRILAYIGLTSWSIISVNIRTPPSNYSILQVVYSQKSAFNRNCWKEPLIVLHCAAFHITFFKIKLYCT